MADSDDDDKQELIIKKIIKKGGGHHGGAWKVAYADFVTAMMAFFLLMWLLNATTQEQKEALANYFDPTHPMISDVNSGAGGILAGQSLAETGAMSSTRAPPVAKQDDGRRNKTKTQREKFEETLKAREQARYKDVEQKIKQAIESKEALRKLSKNIMIDMTAEGLRIQLVDQEGESMFPSGSARMFQKTREILGTISEIIRDVPNDLSVRGHTDSVSYAEGAEYTNWELSADRANSSRRVMEETGILPDKIKNVQGKADTEHLFPDTPNDPRNRRVSIILLNQDFSDIPSPLGMRDDEIVEEAASEDAPQSSDIRFTDDAEAGATGTSGESGNGDTSTNTPLYNPSRGNIEFP